MKATRYSDVVQDFSNLSDEELKKAIEDEEKRCDDPTQWQPIE